MAAAPPEDQMGSIRFVLLMLGLAACFMAARYAVPHLISGVAYYVAVALCTLGLCGAVIGLLRS